MKPFYKICLLGGGVMLAAGILIGGAGLVIAEVTGVLNREWGDSYEAVEAVTWVAQEPVPDAGISELTAEESAVWRAGGSVYEFPYDEIRALNVDVGIAEVHLLSDSSFRVEAFDYIPENFSCEVADGVLTVRDTTDEDAWNEWLGEALDGSWSGSAPEIFIYLPEYQADSITLSASAGTIYAEAPLYAQTADISAGIGSISIDRMEINGSSFYEIGAGELTIYDLTAEDITVDCGIGTAYLTGDIGGDCMLDCGVGSIYLETWKPYSGFDYRIECGIGSVAINDRDYDGIAKSVTIENGADSVFSIECGVGEVQLVTG